MTQEQYTFVPAIVLDGGRVRKMEIIWTQHYFHVNNPNIVFAQNEYGICKSTFFVNRVRTFCTVPKREYFLYFENIYEN